MAEVSSSEMATRNAAMRSQLDASAPKSADQPAENIFDLITQGLEKMIGALGKSVANVNLTGIGKTSVLANVDIQQAAPVKADSKIAHGRVMGIGSDTNPTIATSIINGLQLASIKDIKSEALSYGNAPAVDVSWAQLGELSPQHFAGAARDPGITTGLV